MRLRSRKYFRKNLFCFISLWEFFVFQEYFHCRPRVNLFMIQSNTSELFSSPLPGHFLGLCNHWRWGFSPLRSASKALKRYNPKLTANSSKCAFSSFNLNFFLVRATIIKKTYLDQMTKKPKNKTQSNENVVANVISIDLLLNINWKVSNQELFVGKLAWVLHSHGSKLKYKIRTCNFGFRVYNWVC